MSGSGQERTRISRILRIIFRVAARLQISQTWINWELIIDNWKLYHVREWTKVNTNHTNILESLRDRRLHRLFFYLTQIAQIAQIFFLTTDWTDWTDVFRWQTTVCFVREQRLLLFWSTSESEFSWFFSKKSTHHLKRILICVNPFYLCSLNYYFSWTGPLLFTVFPLAGPWTVQDAPGR